MRPRVSRGRRCSCRFSIAGVACALTGLCYAELASTLPVTGSAYTYSYTTLGEVVAWITGWLMVLELGIAVSLVAVGFSGYTVSLLRDFGIAVPPELANAYINAVNTPDGVRFVTGQGFNLVAVIGVFIAAILLIIGIETSVAVTRVVVTAKIVVLVAFAIIGSQYIESVNWTPFIPEQRRGVLLRLAGRLPCGLGDLLRLRRFRNRLHGGRRSPQPTARLADRHHRLARSCAP